MVVRVAGHSYPRGPSYLSLKLSAPPRALVCDRRSLVPLWLKTVFPLCGRMPACGPGSFCKR